MFSRIFTTRLKQLSAYIPPDTEANGHDCASSPLVERYI